jgi:lipid-A-disaccharide synthase-like uncharacterized protein
MEVIRQFIDVRVLKLVSIGVGISNFALIYFHSQVDCQQSQRVGEIAIFLFACTFFLDCLRAMKRDRNFIPTQFAFITVMIGHGMCAH